MSASASPILEFAHLNVRLGEREILRDVSGELRAGEIVALLGPNGSGKTTLLRGLLGHVRSSGSIRWNAHDVHTMTPRALAKVAAYLPQTSGVDPGHRVRDVLMLGRWPHQGWLDLETRSDARVIEDVSKWLEIDGLLDRRLDQLSGGQRQRVLVARCLAQEPSALLLDEPSTFLDLRHQVELHELLHRLARQRGVAVMMASHDLNLASAYADRVMLLHDGTLRAQGSAREVLTSDLIQSVYDTSVRRLELDNGQIVLVSDVRV